MTKKSPSRRDNFILENCLKGVRDNLTLRPGHDSFADSCLGSNNEWVEDHAEAKMRRRAFFLIAEECKALKDVKGRIEVLEESRANDLLLDEGKLTQ